MVDYSEDLKIGSKIENLVVGSISLLSSTDKVLRAMDERVDVLRDDTKYIFEIKREDCNKDFPRGEEIIALKGIVKEIGKEIVKTPYTEKEVKKITLEKATWTKRYTFEIYTCHPETGETGWNIENVIVFADDFEKAKEKVKQFPNFDCFITSGDWFGYSKDWPVIE